MQSQLTCAMRVETAYYSAQIFPAVCSLCGKEVDGDVYDAEVDYRPLCASCRPKRGHPGEGEEN